MPSPATIPSWYPVAHGDDLVARHVFAGELGGVELALWRDDDGCVNAWENRCCHRSARLSLGVNMGRRLRCQYHGWQYRSGDGQCVVLPAASQSPPPLSVRANTFRIAEARGFTWVSLDAAGPTLDDDLPHWLLNPNPAAGTADYALRSFVFGVDVGVIGDLLTTYADHDGDLPGDCSWQHTGHALAIAWEGAEGSGRLTFLLHPARPRKVVVHTLLELPQPLSQEALRHWRRRHFDAVGSLRRALVRGGSVPAVPPRDGAFVLAPKQPVDTRQRSRQMVAARVTAVSATAAEILTLELEPDRPGDIGALADFVPGAHVDLETPAGIMRQYSIVNQPGEVNASSVRKIPGIRLGIKREPQSRGGSASLHDTLAVGDVLRTSRPKNHFRLASGRNALLLAGGIGVTPLLSMAGSLAVDTRQACALHYFVRDAKHVAFAAQVRALPRAAVHLALTPDETRARIADILGAVAEDWEVYVCGPRPFLDTVLSEAGRLGIVEDRIHFELFSNEVTHRNDKPFHVKLARSGEILEVPADRSLADVLIEHGCAVETSCEQGVCGTCMVKVLEGEPEHRDVYLSADERRRCMQSCVSRSSSELLILDL